METSINNYYYGALLSQAAYGDYSAVTFGVDGFGNDDEVRKALIKTGAGEPEYTNEQAKIFQDRFELTAENMIQARDSEPHYFSIKPRVNTLWQLVVQIPMRFSEMLLLRTL